MCVRVCGRGFVCAHNCTCVPVCVLDCYSVFCNFRCVPNIVYIGLAVCINHYNAVDICFA